jgi:hypothetical protein
VRTLATITGNHQRLNRLVLEPFDATAVRIRITKTNGIKEARLFEVRCYG